MLYTQPITDIIRRRFSSRSYLSKLLEPEKREQLSKWLSASVTGPLGAKVRFELAAAAAQDWDALKGLGTYGFIKGAAGFIIGAVSQSEKNLEDYGYLLERAVLMATDLGLGTCWLGGSFSKSNFSRKISTGPDEQVPAVVALGYRTEKRGRLDAFIRRQAGSDGRLPWARLFFDRTFADPLLREAAGAYTLPLEMVRLGPSASNRQPWRIIKDGQIWHFYVQRTRGYGARSLALLKMADLQRVDMGIAMSHFELTAQEAGLFGQWIIHEPNIAKPDGLTEYTVSWVEKPNETSK
ncbi:MAG: nitroreductase [Desulfobacteraceae bacterium]|nr:MAG: nitroreductase [Desulfobacteraceae bacterium]